MISDYQTQLAQARANLVAAPKTAFFRPGRKSLVDQAKADQQQAAVAGAQAIAERAEADRVRYQSVQSNAVSRSQIDLAQAQASSTTANVEVARNQAKAAAAQVDLDRAELETAASQVGEVEASLQPGGIESFLHKGARAAGWARDSPHGRARRLRRSRPVAAGHRAGQRLGGRQFQGNAAREHPAGPAGDHPR